VYWGLEYVGLTIASDFPTKTLFVWEYIYKKNIFEAINATKPSAFTEGIFVLHSPSTLRGDIINEVPFSALPMK